MSRRAGIVRVGQEETRGGRVEQPHRRRAADGDFRQDQGVEEMRLMVADDQHVQSVGAAVAIEIEAIIDRCRVAIASRIVADQQHVDGVGLCVGRRVTRLADCVAEVEHIGFDQPGSAGCKHGHFEPLVLHGAVGPDDGDAVGAVGSATHPDRNGLGKRGGDPG